MLGFRIRLLVAATALFGAACGAAQAASSQSSAGASNAGQPIDFSVRTEVSPVPTSGLKSLKWDARKGRWGVTLNMDEPDARPSSLNDVQAGAYYHITPSLRVGGAVALGDEQLTPGPKKIGSEESQPRVRLESSFKF